MKRIFVVRTVVTPEQREDNPYAGSGPFCVKASTPRGACRAVRNMFHHMITNHISRERHALECEGYISDRTGKELRRFQYSMRTRCF